MIETTVMMIDCDNDDVDDGYDVDGNDHDHDDYDHTFDDSHNDIALRYDLLMTYLNLLV